MTRPPAVAGHFYSAEPSKLSSDVDSMLAAERAEKMRCRACMVPHAGYIYSGRVAAAVYARLEIPARLILIGPRHYPRGSSLAILSSGAWETPLGDAPIDAALAEKISRAFPLLREDAVAHGSEHSLEVQLPFLQRAASGWTFVPIVLGPVRYEQLAELGRAVAEVIRAETEPVLLIASSDMNHYESDEITRVKDRKALDRITALDPQGLYDVVRKEDISMCGYGAAVVMLEAARGLGAAPPELVRYATSGEINGDLSRVVGYAGVVIR